MKSVILLTVYRRYYELSKTLHALSGIKSLLPVSPPVVVVWAAPEEGRRWFFDELKANGLVDWVIERPGLPMDGPDKPTTVPESLNIRLGLEAAFRKYQPDLVIFHAADVIPTAKCFQFILRGLREGNKAILFYWSCSTIVGGSYHTNMFAVPNDERYWPPMSESVHYDVLERQWFKKLEDQKLCDLFCLANPDNMFFFHSHQSETQPAWPIVPIKYSGDLGLTVIGYMTWYQRLVYELTKGARTWRRWYANTIRTINTYLSKWMGKS